MNGARGKAPLMPNSPTATREGVEERARECLAKHTGPGLNGIIPGVIIREAAIRAMLAFAQPERLADGWQDIATAPREGYFLVWGPHHPELAFPYEAERFWKARDPGFPGHLSSKAFTLWHRMPLPEPPATAIRSADQ